MSRIRADYRLKTKRKRSLPPLHKAEKEWLGHTVRTKHGTGQVWSLGPRGSLWVALPDQEVVRVLPAEITKVVAAAEPLAA